MPGGFFSPMWEIHPRDVILPGSGPSDLEHFRWMPRQEGQVLSVSLTNWVSVSNPGGPGHFGSLEVEVFPR